MTVILVGALSGPADFDHIQSLSEILRYGKTRAQIEEERKIEEQQKIEREERRLKQELKRKQRLELDGPDGPHRGRGRGGGGLGL